MSLDAFLDRLAVCACFAFVVLCIAQIVVTFNF